MNYFVNLKRALIPIIVKNCRRLLGNPSSTPLQSEDQFDPVTHIKSATQNYNIGENAIPQDESDLLNICMADIVEG